MANNRNQLNFEQVYKQGKDPKKSQGSDANLNKLVKEAFSEGMDFLDNPEFIEEMENYPQAQEVPENLDSVISTIYKVFTESTCKDGKNFDKNPRTTE